MADMMGALALLSSFFSLLVLLCDLSIMYFLLWSVMSNSGHISPIGFISIYSNL